MVPLQMMAPPVTRLQALQHRTASHALAVRSRQLYFRHIARQRRPHRWPTGDSRQSTEHRRIAAVIGNRVQDMALASTVHTVNVKKPP